MTMRENQSEKIAVAAQPVDLWMTGCIKRIAVEGETEIEEDPRTAALEFDARTSDLSRASMNFDTQRDFPKLASLKHFSTKSASWSTSLPQARLRPMSEELKSALGAKIRAARLHRKLTQEDLADRVERTPESISNIERGLQLPSVDTLLELSRTLGVSATDLFEGMDHQSRKSRKRAQLEAQLHEIGRDLSDRDLKIAVAQANVLLTAK